MEKTKTGQKPTSEFKQSKTFETFAFNSSQNEERERMSGFTTLEHNDAACNIKEESKTSTIYTAAQYENLKTIPEKKFSVRRKQKKFDICNTKIK